MFFGRNVSLAKSGLREEWDSSGGQRGGRAQCRVTELSRARHLRRELDKSERIGAFGSEVLANALRRYKRWRGSVHKAAPTEGSPRGLKVSAAGRTGSGMESNAGVKKRERISVS